MRDLARRLGAGDGQHAGDLVRGRGRAPRRARLVAQQARNALLGKALLPAPHGRAAHTRSLGDLQHRQMVGGVENDAGPLDVFLRTAAVGDDGEKALAISRTEQNARGLGHPPDSHASPDL
jgi:hypothetical protein